MNNTLPVSEVYGTVIQGEGMLIGRPTVFLRFGGCDYRCLASGTLVHRSDLSATKIEQLQPGDDVIGYARVGAENGPYRMVAAVVEAVRSVQSDETIAITLDDGTQLVSSPDHRWWVEQVRNGWVWKSPHRQGVEGNYREAQAIRVGDFIKGPGAAMIPPPQTELWRRGYLTGSMDGDGHESKSWIALRVTSRSFFDAVMDASVAVGAPFAEFASSVTTHGTPLFRARLPEQHRDSYTEATAWDDDPEFARGYLAGMFDAEGHVPSSAPYIAQNDGMILERAVVAAHSLGLDYRVWSKDGRACRLYLDQHPATLLPMLDVQCHHKRIAAASRGLNKQRRQVVGIERRDGATLYDIQTSTGNFMANGMVSHNCSWCDSLYAVLPEHASTWERLTDDEIFDRLQACYPAGASFKHVTMSGGNPAIHKRMDALLHLLHGEGYRIAIETQGSLCPEWLGIVDDVTLSPKPPSSGNITPFQNGSILERIITKTCKHHIHAHNASICLKVVVFDNDDYAYAQAVHSWYPSVPFFLQVGTQVGQDTRDDLCAALMTLQDRVLMDPTMQDVSVLPQLHALLRGHARGI